MLEGQASEILKIDLSQLSRLGIDEIALVKGQGNYLAVLVDLDTSRTNRNSEVASDIRNPFSR